MRTLCEDELFFLSDSGVASDVAPELAVFLLEGLLAPFKVLDKLFELHLLSLEVVLFQLPVGALLLDREKQLSALRLRVFRFFLRLRKPRFESLFISEELNRKFLDSAAGFGLELGVGGLESDLVLLGFLQPLVKLAHLVELRLAVGTQLLLRDRQLPLQPLRALLQLTG